MNFDHLKYGPSCPIAKLCSIGWGCSSCRVAQGVLRRTNPASCMHEKEMKPAGSALKLLILKLCKKLWDTFRF